MTARKINDTSWWVDFRYNGKRYRIRSLENSRAGAAAYEALLRHKLVRGEPLKPTQDQTKPITNTFKSFAERWVETHVKTNNKRKEQIRKESVLNVHLYPVFGQKNLVEITNRSIEEFKATLQKSGLAPNSVNNVLTVLSRCLRSAVEWGELESMPVFRRVKVPPTRFDFLSPDDTDTLLKTSEGGIWHDMFLLACRTGMRFGEIIVLEWKDIDFALMQITVQRSLSHDEVTAPKNNKERYIPLTPDLYQRLLMLKKNSGLVFRAVGRNYISHSMARKALEKTCRQAGVRKIGWHTLRHTFASQLVSAGISIRIVQELLGHADTKTTLRYAHLSPSSLQEAIKVLTRPRLAANVFFGQPVGNQMETLQILLPKIVDIPVPLLAKLSPET